LKIDELIQESWRIYARFGEQPFLVKPSIPILFFGDSEQYFRSKLRVITVGLNPSRNEFPNGDRFSRFSNARKIYPSIRDGASYDKYLQALNGYFHRPPNDPLDKWFNSYEPLLSGLDCSYYGVAPNTVLHTDLCSPLATDPTWSKLPGETQTKLLREGTPLWHSLVGWLSPDLIIASVRRSHLKMISFPRQRDWDVVYTIERANPYRVEVTKVKLTDGKVARLAFGKAAQMPFGTVSNPDKRKVGAALKNHIYG
jgi:hypothetical protein